MSDREKVIKGLEFCTSFISCKGCPYEDNEFCESELKADALNLLKEQHEQIETLESLRRIEQKGR